jgi:hypothetical protein
VVFLNFKHETFSRHSLVFSKHINFRFKLLKVLSFALFKVWLVPKNLRKLGNSLALNTSTFILVARFSFKTIKSPKKTFSYLKLFIKWLIMCFESSMEKVSGKLWLMLKLNFVNFKTSMPAAETYHFEAFCDDENWESFRHTSFKKS